MRRSRYEVVRPNRRRRAELVEARGQAAALRQAFMDEAARDIEEMPWDWPRHLQHIGRVEAVLYASEKWDGGGAGSVDYAGVMRSPWRIEEMQSEGRVHSYKHIAESTQDLLIVPGVLGDGDTDPTGRTPLSVHGDDVDLTGPLPDSFAVLAPALELQATLFDARGRLGPTVELDLEGSLWGAAPLDEGGVMLFNYDTSGVRLVVLGDELDVEKDGIVG